MLAALSTGILLGLSCGLAPGPLLALVLAQSLRHGWREGCKIAVTPLLTDAPIVILTLGVAAALPLLRPLLGLLSIAGGVFIVHLARAYLRPPRPDLAAPPEAPASWRKGILTNLLSPHPWLFWLTVGAATLARALAQGRWVAGAFLGGFYFMLVGSKVILALLAARSRRLLASRGYRAVMAALAILLGLFALFLVLEGVNLLATR